MQPKEVADYLIANRRACRTGKGRECPVCGHRDSHCLRLDDGTAALCPKADGTGSVRKYGEYGYLYVLAGMEQATFPPVEKQPERTDEQLHAIWEPLAMRWRDAGKGEVGRLACTLGVSVESLARICCGWDGKAWTFPERNGDGLIIGVSRRFEDGAKRCATGSRRGLTFAEPFTASESAVLIVEGASDVAAGLTMGLVVVGRPSNMGGVPMLCRLLRDSRGPVIVIGERDKKTDGRWPGMEGAKSVAKQLAKVLKRRVSARLLPNGAKDLRAWWNARTDSPLDAGMELIKCM